jgi:hypothetical protein
VCPTRRRLLGTAALLPALALTAACGDQTPSSAPEADACSGQGAVIAKADLDGSGSSREVRLTSPGSGPCADRLVGPGGESADVAGLDLVAAHAKVVHLHGDDPVDLVLVSAKPHPRGGAQVHLFGLGGRSGLRELTAAGQPLVPFVATDGGAAPMTATCTDDGGIGVVTAEAHEPPGVVLAWDVTQTTYAIDDGRAVPKGKSSVADAAADPLLRRERPELFDGSLFSDCS